MAPWFASDEAEIWGMFPEQLDALVGLGVPRIEIQRLLELSECLLGEFVGGSGVCIYVVVVELRERGVHVGVGQQVVEVCIDRGEGGGFVEVVNGALVVAGFSPGDAAPGIALGGVGLKRDHLGEVVDGADVVAVAVLVVGVPLQDFIPFVGPGLLVRLVVCFDGVFVRAHAGHGFGHSDVRVRHVGEQVYGLPGGGSRSVVVAFADEVVAAVQQELGLYRVAGCYSGSELVGGFGGHAGLSLGRLKARSRHCGGLGLVVVGTLRRWQCW